MAPFSLSKKSLLWLLMPISAVCVAFYGNRILNLNPSQCALLSHALPGGVSYPNTTTYAASLTSYWSVQEESFSPSCIISPQNTKEVATAVGILSAQLPQYAVDFAIRGGGHTPFAGSANIDGGIVIDLRALNGVDVNAKQTIASVGAGAIWGEVYSKLDTLGLAVIGGRGSTIGVGGLTTGGGISFFSPRKGFACDNVANYEVVLAGGRIVNANREENPDLWLALKGGINNFGIVTRFDLLAFPQADFWGGMIVWDDSAVPQLLSALAALDTADYDEFAALILSMAFVSSSGFIASGTIQYTKPEANPPTFQPFTSAMPQYANSMRISNLTDFVTEFVELQGNGKRQLYVTSTFQSSLAFLTEIYSHFKATLPPFSNVPNFVASLTLQPISPDLVSKAAALGGNSLGLQSPTPPLVLCLLAFTWESAGDDAAVEALGKSLNAWIVDQAKIGGLWNQWVYLNYAASWQNPIGGYGAVNKVKLQAASRKYDPTGVFQKRVPGGFKLFV
ncbi:Bifunctional solanapyrone synthase [Lachnellula suecica]|uniref:Bifunctional solanapyrone synthase n=1 Tax=Lachnellula suecica TaxID=602035 RepID=A0A8T9BUZ6_9HELO|nr:Bifunctional solanapyrone synthase [Lachnellula suecica]